MASDRISFSPNGAIVIYGRLQPIVTTIAAVTAKYRFIFIVPLLFAFSDVRLLGIDNMSGL